MSDPRCERVLERLPDLAADRLDDVSAAELSRHVAGCAECAEELRLLRVLAAGTPPVPAGLEARIRAAAVGDRRRGTRPWWGLAAAAVAAVALGIGVISDGSGTVDVPEYVAEGGAVEAWISSDGEIAGAAALDDLSEEALLTLLDELGTGGAG